MSEVNINSEAGQKAGRCLDNLIKEVNSELTGACMVPITLPKKEMLRVIREAKKWFYKNYEYSVEEFYLVIPRENFNTKEFRENRTLTMPGPADDGSGWLYSITEFKVAGEEALGLSGKASFIDKDFALDKFVIGSVYGYPYASQTGDNLLYYVVSEKYFDLARQVLVNKISFDYNRLNRKLKILGEKPNNHVVLQAYFTIDDCSLFEDEIFQRYVVAKSKAILGRMLNTFNYNLPGNIQINGSEIQQEGKEELDEIKEELKNSEGTDFFLTS